jgi:hypothetical protein
MTMAGPQPTRAVRGRELWAVVLAPIGLLLVAAAVLFGVEYGLHELDLSDGVLISVAIVAGLALLLFVVIAMVVVYDQLGLSVRQEALGLPPGSIRAILAFGLLVVFVGIAIYLISADKLADDGQAAAGLLGTVGTLAVSVAAFYFGTSAVKTGANTVAALTSVRRPPTADTKGSEPAGDAGWRLIGFVNPNGAETRTYFEYGSTDGNYEGSTRVQLLAASTDTVRVTTDEKLEPGTFFRIVAHNERGQAVGSADRIATDDQGGGQPQPGQPEPEPSSPQAAPPELAQPPPVAEQPPPVAEQPPPVAEQPPPVAEQPPPVAEQPPPEPEQPPPEAEPPPEPEQPPPEAEQSPPEAEQAPREGEEPPTS